MKPRKEVGLFAVLAEVLNDLPKLADPSCAARPDLFDPAGENETPTSVRARHALAVEICSDCPCLDRCHDWSLTQRNEGSVLGGRLPSSQPRVASA